MQCLDLGVQSVMEDLGKPECQLPTAHNLHFFPPVLRQVTLSCPKNHLAKFTSDGIVQERCMIFLGAQVSGKMKDVTSVEDIYMVGRDLTSDSIS